MAKKRRLRRRVCEKTLNFYLYMLIFSNFKVIYIVWFGLKSVRAIFIPYTNLIFRIRAFPEPEPTIFFIHLDWFGSVFIDFKENCHP